MMVKVIKRLQVAGVLVEVEEWVSKDGAQASCS